MTKTIGVERFVVRQQTKATQQERAKEKAKEKRRALLESTKVAAQRYKSMSRNRAKNALRSALATSEPLNLLFIARYLGMGDHREELADFLRVAFATACFAGDHKGAKRAQEALGSLLQKERAFFTCGCAPVELPRMTMCL